MAIKGIDVSSHQRTINWTKVKNDGVKFAIIRAGYGQTHTDDYFTANAKGAIAAGIPIGIYWFSYALNEKQALEEARKCVEVIKAYKITLPVFYDFEYDSVNYAKKNGVTVTKSLFNKFTKIFCDYIQSKGYKAGVYYNLDYKRRFVDSSICGKYYQWLAHYTGDQDKDYAVHQYSESGKVSGISTGKVDMNWLNDESLLRHSSTITANASKNDKSKLNMTEAQARQKVADIITSWKGASKGSATHKEIIRIYNTITPLPRGVEMLISYDWCAATVSAVFQKAGMSSIFPSECSCSLIIKGAKKMGIWVENDAYVPSMGDAVIYDWEDTGKGDNTGDPDHIGLVTSVDKKNNVFYVTEGNYSNSVKVRKMQINGRFIRGFVAPKFSSIVTGKTDSTITTTKDTIKVDGVWGTETTKALQKIFKTTVDGIISNQPSSNKKYLSAAKTNSWEFKDSNYKAGSQLIRALQRKINADADGLFGKQSVIALQGFLKVTQDGYMGKETVKSLQKWINKNL